MRHLLGLHLVTFSKSSAQSLFVAISRSAPAALSPSTARCNHNRGNTAKWLTASPRGKNFPQEGIYCRMRFAYGGDDSQAVPATLTASSDGVATPASGTRVSAVSTGPSSAPDDILIPLQRSMEWKERGGPKTLLYFAFGANMSPSILTNKRGVKPLASLPAEATDFVTTAGQMDRLSLGGGNDGGQGLCLCFSHRAGYGTLARKPGPPQTWEISPGAHGVLYTITSSDLAKIAASENGYRIRRVKVETPTGATDVAVCFISNPWQTLPTSVPPTSRYLALLQDGAAHHGINERYCKWLANLPSVSPEEAATSPARVNTPSKVAIDMAVATAAIASLGSAMTALLP